MKSQAKQTGIMLLAVFGVMLVVRFTAYSQQPFWDILIGWSYIMWLDLIPIEGSIPMAMVPQFGQKFRRGFAWRSISLL